MPDYRVNLITFFATHPSSLHPPLHLLHIRFPPPTRDFTLPLCPFLIPSCLRNSLYLPLPHHVFGVSFSEILGNSGFCHSTGFSFLLSLFLAPSSLKGSSQSMVVSDTLKAPPTSPGSDAIPYPLTIVSLSCDDDAGVLVLGACLHFSNAYGSIPDTHLTA